MRIAKNETAHEIRPRFSTIVRFIHSPTLFIVGGLNCRCCQERSRKCQDLYGVLVDVSAGFNVRGMMDQGCSVARRYRHCLAQTE
jgi:hypothetical protein